MTPGAWFVCILLSISSLLLVPIARDCIKDWKAIIKRWRGKA